VNRPDEMFTRSDVLLQRLMSVSHFQGLPRSQVQSILNAGSILRSPACTTIFHEGEECSGLFVLLKGKIHLIKRSTEGQEYILSVIEPVIMFNEVSALDRKQNPVSAVTVQDSILWHATAESFHSLLMQIPQVALGLLSVLAARNRVLLSQFEDLSMRSTLGRAAKLLLEISDHGKVSILRREHTNQIMASRIATVPEAFSRALRCFKDQGLIETTRYAITVTNPERLACVGGISIPII